MILPPDYDYQEEERTVISNVVWNFMHPKQPDNPYVMFLDYFGLIKNKEPNPQEAADFIQECLKSQHKNNPDYINELGRIREIHARGRAVPVINRPSRHKGTDFKLIRKHRVKYTPQINVSGKYINQLRPNPAIKAVLNSDTTPAIKADLIGLILKEKGLI